MNSHRNKQINIGQNGLENEPIRPGKSAPSFVLFCSNYKPANKAIKANFFSALARDEFRTTKNRMHFHLMCANEHPICRYRF